MNWGHEWILLLSAAIPFFFILRLLWSRRIKKQQKQIGISNKKLTKSHNKNLSLIRVFVLWGSMLFLLISLAMPRWGQAEKNRYGSGANLIFMLDCSRSMLAKDLYPDRMEVAKRKAIAFIENEPNHRVALMPFAGKSILRSPLTGDVSVIRDMLKDCSPELFPAKHGQQGTAIGTTLSDCIKLRKENAEDRSWGIIIFSDGSDTDTEAVEKATKEAKEAGIPVYGLFLGDTEKEVSIIIDGKKVIMKANRETIDNIASETNAISINSTINDDDVKEIGKHINEHLNLKKWKEKQMVAKMEKYQLFLIIAITLLAIGYFIPTTKKAKK